VACMRSAMLLVDDPGTDACLTAALDVVMKANLTRSDSSEPATDIGVSFDTDHTVSDQQLSLQLLQYSTVL